MKDTIIKINLLAYPDAKALIDYCPKDPTLEDVLVALGKIYGFEIKETLFNYEVNIRFKDMHFFSWQLTKTLTQQSEETQKTIKQIFEDGKTN